MCFLAKHKLNWTALFQPFSLNLELKSTFIKEKQNVNVNLICGYYINTYFSTSIHMEDVENITYQMIHRLASACSTKKENISVFYFLYDVNSHMKDYYVNSLKLIYELINKKANIGIWNFESNPISEYLELEKKFDNGSRNQHIDVIPYLLNKQIMDVTLIEKLIFPKL